MSIVTSPHLYLNAHYSYAHCVHYSTSLYSFTSRDKSEARYDDGVVDIRANAITLKKEVPFYTDQVTSQRAKLYTLELDRGLEWPKVRPVNVASTVRQAQSGD